MILFIDSTNFSSVTFALMPQKNAPAQKPARLSYVLGNHESHAVLGKLADFLKKTKVTGPQITKIVVNKGPGSYTGTRIGVAYGKALSLAWGVPVSFLTAEKFFKNLVQ